MTIRIAVSGKGGTGKTTVAALLVHLLAKRGHHPILAIDADPNRCLGELLGVKPSQTIGDLREELLERRDNLPAGLSKPQYIQLKVRAAMAEEEHYDLLTMGRPEGPGCYCYVNSVLRSFMDTLSEEYPYIVMDNEAGMEHLSRRTTNDLDVLFIIAIPSRLSIESAARVRDLADEMELDIGAMRLVINRVQDPELVRPVAEEFGFSGFDTLPHDEALARAALSGTPLTALEDHLPIFAAVEKIAREYVPHYQRRR